MALIANIERIKEAMGRSDALRHVYEYMQSIAGGGKEAHGRVMSLRPNDKNKIALSHEIFAIEQSYQTKPYSEAFFESHEKYVDFQLVIHGRERFYIGEKGDFVLKDSYNGENDLIVYEAPMQESCSSLLLTSKTLAIFLPYDVHAGGIHAALASEVVFKSVIKVPKEIAISLF